jgi:acyl-CoA synthetase (AMP-forming)/AMP-acid ligase II
MAKQFHLADLFESVAQAVPDRLAVISDSTRLTFAELDARCDRLAGGLAACGVVRGDTVGLYLHNGPAYLEGFIAASKLGAVPFNVNYRYRVEELAYLFDNADAAAIIHGAEFSPIMRELRPRLPKVRVSVAVDDGSVTDKTGSVSYAELVAHQPGGSRERSEADIILSYTGGTTGMPKGVMWPHRAFVFACAGGAGYFNSVGPLIEPEDIFDRVEKGYPLRMFPVAPLMHDTVEREQANMVQFVGDAMAIPLRDALQANPGRWQLGHVVNLGSGGAVFSQHVKDDLKAMVPSANITDGMGSTETGVSGMAGTSSEGVLRIPANAEQQVVIDGRIAGEGEAGLIARGGHIPVGYYNDPEKTAETFQTIAGKLWAVSGDSGRLDPDGMITMFGRGSTCINSGGEKIFPEEVEEALRGHPAIYDAVVVGRPDPRWGETVVAVVSGRDAVERPSLGDLRDYLGGHLAGYKQPRDLVWVDAVRRSPAGKQDYRWAKELAATT